MEGWKGRLEVIEGLRYGEGIYPSTPRQKSASGCFTCFQDRRHICQQGAVNPLGLEII